MSLDAVEQAAMSKHSRSTGVERRVIVMSVSSGVGWLPCVQPTTAVVRQRSSYDSTRQAQEVRLR